MANIIEITDKFPLVHKTIKVGKIPVIIRMFLDVDTFASAVHTIADTCFVDGEYRPEYYEIAKRYMVMKYMTDVDLGDMNVSEVFKVTQNDWYRVIENECVNSTVYVDILKAADELIDYLIRTRQTKFDDLCDTLKVFADKAGDTKSLEEIAERIKNLDDKQVAEAILDK